MIFLKLQNFVPKLLIKFFEVLPDDYLFITYYYYFLEILLTKNEFLI